jgi:uncharacterized protein
VICITSTSGYGVRYCQRKIVAGGGRSELAALVATGNVATVRPLTRPHSLNRRRCCIGAHDRWQERWVTISGYPCPVREPTTAATMRLRAVLTLHRSRISEVLDRYSATNPRLFGSVARGDADEDSDLDLLVDLTPGAGNELLRVCGLAEELSELLGVRVDVVAAPLLRDTVSVTALADAVAV